MQVEINIIPSKLVYDMLTGFRKYRDVIMQRTLIPKSEILH